MKKLLKCFLVVMLIVVTAMSFTACKKDKKKDEKEMTPSRFIQKMDYDLTLIDDPEGIDDLMGLWQQTGNVEAAVTSEGEEYPNTFLNALWCKDAESAKNLAMGMSSFIKGWNETGPYNPSQVAIKGRIVLVGYGDIFEDAYEELGAKFVEV